MFLLVYYTDVVGLSAAAAGTLFRLVRLWDAFADVFAGRLVDETLDPVGQVPAVHPVRFAAAAAAERRRVSVPDTGNDAQYAYAFTSYALLGLAYSLVNIPLRVARRRDDAGAGRARRSWPRSGCRVRT